jgi:hypothetical protein
MSIGKLPAPADVIPFEVWSGGQTGVDRGALEGAQGTGLPTGGFAPKDWITEKGPAPELGTKFGLKECYEDGYPPRTRENVLHCDVTVLITNDPFSNLSSGSSDSGTALTARLCEQYGKPVYQILYQGTAKDPLQGVSHEAYYLAWWLLTFPNLKRVNFAGNRESKAPGIQVFTRWLLVTMGSEYRDRYWLYRERQPPFPGSTAEEEPVEDLTEVEEIEDLSEEIEDLTVSDSSFPEDAPAISPSGEDEEAIEDLTQEEEIHVEP